MALFSIDGTEYAAPAGIEFALNPLDSSAERSMDGNLNRSLIAKKRKYTLTWRFIPDNREFQRLYRKLQSLGEFALFTLPDPSGGLATFQGYVGDISVTMLRYWDAGEGREAEWQNLKTSVIER